MAGVNPTTTEAVFSLEHPLPTYPAGKFKKEPTSISETARSRKVPKTLKIVPVTKYLEIAERFKDAVLNQVDQSLIVPGGISLERYSEQDNVCAYNLHVIHPVMECLNNITSSDTYEVRHTWEHQLCLPNIPKPRHTADDGDESEIDEDAHRPTNKRKRRRTSTTRDSKDYHTEDDDTEHERDHVVVRPDMIGVVKPKGSKINFGHGNEDATSICVLYVEMKTTGTLDCRIPNFEKAAIAETPPPEPLQNAPKSP
ncbi:hypothetical protein BDP81DRAFT_397036 [Colletotrichum phormii]|uniref:Uncharacterized protein n=1 Tax=Colletotrichum phormii TaxID=359342 RepID=A0AAI9ZL42_9PEZI|nr:uncharacterized protein BDP81DRAFT_397036 [Colletotrichum phormii]KAK1633681.1 hypothetical protein BDP81DRAFT_397036 [Colletotrichum phormii]